MRDRVGPTPPPVADAIYLSRICRKVYILEAYFSATAIYNTKLKEFDNVEMEHGRRIFDPWARTAR